MIYPLAVLTSVIAAFVAYTQTVGGIEVLLYGLASWCGGFAVALLIDHIRGER